MTDEIIESESLVEGNEEIRKEPTALTNRNSLKAAFADNQRPCGDDFAKLIDSMVVQNDDGLIVDANELIIDNNVGVSGDLYVKGDGQYTKITKDSLVISESGGSDAKSHAELTTSKLSVSEQLSFTKDQSFKVFSSLNVNPDSLNGNQVNINKDDVAISVEGDARVTGKVIAEASASFGETLSITDDSVSVNAELDIVGETQITGSLDISDHVNVQQAVHIGKSGEADSALLTIEALNQKDTDDNLLEARSSSGYDIIINHNGRVGFGHDEPVNGLDIKQSVLIGPYSAPVTPQFSLSVDNCIGVGTVSPDARLDLRAKPNETALNIRQNESSIFAIETGLDNDSSMLTFSGDACIEQSLVVNRDAEFGANIIVTGSSELHGPLTAQHGATIQGELVVSGDSHLNGNLEITGDANISSNLINSGSTSLQSLSVALDARFEGRIQVDQPSVFHQTLAISADEAFISSASLHIKEDSSRSAFRIDNNAGDCSILVNEGAIQFGSENHSMTFSVNGSTQLKGTLTCTHQAEFLNHVVSGEGLSVNLTEKTHEKTAFNVHASGSTNKALNVVFDDTPLLVATQNNVGILCDNPSSPFQVGGESQFDSDVSIKQQLTVFADASASEPLLNISPVHIELGAANRCTNISAYGDTSFNGTVRMNQLAEINDRLITIRQCDLDDAIVLQTLNEQSEWETGLRIGAQQFSMNVEQTDLNFHINGTAQIDSRTLLADTHVRNSLTVSEETHLNSTLNQNGSVRVNNPGNSKVEDVYIRQSSDDQVALRIDQVQGQKATLWVKDDKIAVNSTEPKANLDVAGTMNVRDVVNLESDVRVHQQLNIEGALNSHSNATISGNLGVLGNTTLTGKVNAESDLNVSETLSVKGNVLTASDVGISVAKPLAQFHLAAKADSTALRIDGLNKDDPDLVLDAGNLGLGKLKPECALDVVGDVKVSDELKVDGRTYLESTLDVSQDTLIKSDLTVKEKTRLREQTILGDLSEGCDPMAQLYIADNRYSEALRIDAEGRDSLVVKDGKLGIGVEVPSKTLDIHGDANITGELEVTAEARFENNVHINENVRIFGSLDSAQKAAFGSDVLIRGDLRVEDKTEIDEELDVKGEATFHTTIQVAKGIVSQGVIRAEGTEIGDNTAIHGSLNVNDSLKLKNNFSFGGCLSSNVDKPKAKVHYKTTSDQPALLIESSGNVGMADKLLVLNELGQLGIGMGIPDAQLDVGGNAIVRGALTSESVIISDAVSAETLALEGGFSISDGPFISGVSNDARMGGDAGSSAILPTQAAVKSYVDSVAVPFGRGGKTHVVSSQGEFDRLFNRYDVTTIASDTTVILLPLNSQDNSISEYALKSTIRMEKNTVIFGFNETTTRIKKRTENARFELDGTAGQPITNVMMDGFTFNGSKIESHKDGGAFYLKHAIDCKLNCRIENHYTYGNGGAIYGYMEDEDTYTVSNIEASSVHNCSAMEQGKGSNVSLNQGGAAYGLSRSRITAYGCSAEQGGAVAYCNDSQVTAEKCKATLAGGAAYRCERLRLYAIDCEADQFIGKGGGACYCSDLFCEGHWVGNNAAEGPHIYATNHLTDSSEERHYWRGDFIGRRIDDGEGVWRVHNE